MEVILKNDCNNVSLKLQDGIPLIIGRGPCTKIKDTRVSRTQLMLTLNAADNSVDVEQVMGTHPSALNGVQLTVGKRRKAHDGDVIEILQSTYFFKLEFSQAKIPLAEEPIPHAAQPAKMGTWSMIAGNSLLTFTSDHIVSRTKVAAFDLGGTIIKTASGRMFPKDCNDWRISSPNVLTKLKQLHEDGYKIVFFTNQGGIGENRIRISEFKEKIQKIAQKLLVPIQVFISTKADIYRKPRVGMWQHLLEHENEDVQINVGESFYCGEAADELVHVERDSKQNGFPYCNKKKDFLNSNRLFAINLNLKFFTPQEYFHFI